MQTSARVLRLLGLVQVVLFVCIGLTIIFSSITQRSTSAYVIERIVQQGGKINEDRVFIPTGNYFHLVDVYILIGRTNIFLGFQSKELIVNNGLALGDVDQYVIYVKK